MTSTTTRTQINKQQKMPGDFRQTHGREMEEEEKRETPLFNLMNAHSKIEHREKLNKHSELNTMCKRT